MRRKLIAAVIAITALLGAGSITAAGASVTAAAPASYYHG